ncbi:NERD domain-containing protein [Paenibacillus montanisoli]|uniref:NERD domain-containing protein n=1 Tax=Paenibacillus montanisoli TaxID=2081970 RepID=A0A328TV07_9BACL|nr:NERD domain-containing protein [Paenibacillus montanisoli]RAP74369.1 NERD domain-containing protein [Paenibacillus montanisoli]
MIYIVALLIVILVIISKSPKLKGIIGEKSVIHKLNKLDESKYITIHNVTLPSALGRTTQIDHIVVSIYGVIVIETKNYRGWIVGDERSEYWTQVIYKRKEKLFNPLRQNYGHIQAIASLFPENSNLPLFGIVSFSGRAELKVKTSEEVVYASKLVRTIEKYNKVLLNRGQVEHIVEVIKSSQIVGKGVNKEHVRAIKEVASTKREMVSKNVCPKCGNELVERSGRYGKFKGCSGYPKCRYIFKG